MSDEKLSEKFNQELDSKADKTIDASGLACPMPLLKAKQGLNKLTSGQCLKLMATDSGSVRDFHSWCELSGHTMYHFSECEPASGAGKEFVFYIIKQ